MPFVVDASSAMSWLLEDELSDYGVWTLELLNTEGAQAPSLWALEIANGLWVAERQKRITAATIMQATDLLLSLPIVLREVDLETALDVVLTVARTENLTAYDASYLELSMRERLPLASNDNQLRKAARRLGVELLAPP